MKALKIVLFILLGLGVLFMILGLIGPKSYDASQSRFISAAPDQVWPYVSNLRKMQEWSPWAEKDPAMVVDWNGEDGTVGSSQSWSGNKEVGKGKQTLTLLEPNQKSEAELMFLEPFENKATAYINLVDTTGGTKIVWGIRGDAPFMMRPMMLFMNFDKAMAADFKHGLDKLKTVVEANKGASTTAFEIKPGEYPGGKFLGVRSVVKMPDMEAYYGKNFPIAMAAAESTGAGVASPPAGVYYSWDMEKGEGDMAAAVAVQKEVKAPAGVSYFTVPASRSLTIDYMGGYSGMMAPHNAMDAYLKANNLEQIAPVIEEYHTDPMTQPDSMKWHTRIIYLVK
jgi:effector-binding domain-containing protein